MDASDRRSLRSLTREEIAGFLVANRGALEDAVVKKLRKNTRGVYDHEDVFGSVARRLDELASQGAIRPRSELELWAFIHTVASGVAISKMRLMATARAFVAEGGTYAVQLEAKLRMCLGDDDATLLTHRMALSLSDAKDRQVFYLKLRGSNDRALAVLLGVTESAVRHRWASIRRELEDRFASGAFDD